MTVLDQRCPVCGLAYGAFRGPYPTMADAAADLKTPGKRVSRPACLRLMAHAKREAWDHHLDTCDLWPADRVSFDALRLEAPRMPQDASGGREAGTAYLSVPDALAGSVVPGIDHGDDFGAEDWTTGP